MNMAHIAEIISKFQSCQECTDEDLNELTEYYWHLLYILRPLGKEFALCRNEIQKRYTQQKECQIARKSKRVI
jgi:hypothetical protein